MRTVEEHATVIAGLLSPTPTELLPLAEAVGLVLTADLVATIDLPPFANSAMDGYAVRAQDVAQFPVTLPVSQDIPAGRTDTRPLTPGTAARIMTGAPMPAGADTIVQVERTDGGVSAVRIDSAPARECTSAPAARTSRPAPSCCRPAPSSGRHRWGWPPPWASPNCPSADRCTSWCCPPGPNSSSRAHRWVLARSMNPTRRCSPPGSPRSAPR